MKLISGTHFVGLFSAIADLNLIMESLKYPEGSPEHKALMALVDRHQAERAASKETQKQNVADDPRPD